MQWLHLESAQSGGSEAAWQLPGRWVQPLFCPSHQLFCPQSLGVAPPVQNTDLETGMRASFGGGEDSARNGRKSGST